MKKAHHIVRHGIDYLLLLTIIGLGFGGLIYFRFDLAAQIADIILMSIFYILWGVLHHHHDNNLTGSVILEYTSMAALVSFILIIFLLRV